MMSTSALLENLDVSPFDSFLSYSLAIVIIYSIDFVFSHQLDTGFKAPLISGCDMF